MNVAYCSASGACSEDKRDEAAANEVIDDLMDNPVSNFFKAIMKRLKANWPIFLAIFIILFCLPVLFIMIKGFFVKKVEDLQLKNKGGIIGSFAKASSEYKEKIKNGGGIPFIDFVKGDNIPKFSPKMLLIIIFFIFIIYNERK